MGYSKENSMKIIESHKIPDEKIKTKKLNSLQSGIKKIQVNTSLVLPIIQK